MTPPDPQLVAQVGVNLQLGPTAQALVEGVVWLLATAALAAAPAAAIAAFYRWYVRERIQTGLALLFGLTAVVIHIGATTALSEVIIGGEDVLAAGAVLLNLAAFLAGGIGAYGGMRVGDRLGVDLFAAAGGRNIDADVSEIVQTVGRVTSVRLPETIDDIVGYDPMPERTKETLANRRLLFPRRLTKAALRDRLVTRLKTDYGVGHVDLELADDGTVDYLAVGSRAAGIGPTLPPSTNAVAIQADPANAASAGDLVQVWERNPARRVLTGEIRGVAGDVVSVAIDAADTPKLDPAAEYRLVTLPVQDRSDREFASLLRAADETMGTATVEPGSSLDGATVGSLAVTVVAITRDDRQPETIPSRERVLAAGDTIYAISTPDDLRRLEQATAGTGEAPDTAAVVDEPEDDAADTDTPSDAADTAGEQIDTEQQESDDDATDSAGDGSAAGDSDAVETDTDDGMADTDEPADSSGDLEIETADDAAESGESPERDDFLESLQNADIDDTFADASEDDGDDPVEVWDPEERLDETDGDDNSDSADSETPTGDGDDSSTADNDPEKPS